MGVRLHTNIVTLLIFLLLPIKLCAQEPCSPLDFGETFLQFGNQARNRVFSDFSNAYSRNSVKNFGASLLVGGVLANTEMDHNFQRWHNRNVRSRSSDEFAKFSKVFGEGQIFIPIAATCAVAYRLHQARLGLPDNTWGNFACRTTRGYATGTPTLLLFQSLLGAGRPSKTTSYWRPFRHHNAVSGHAYIGAVPFITAAQMSDNIYVKGLFYSFSTFTAWSRVNDNGHYLSQALLGWYLAYLSVRAVLATEADSPLPRGMTIFPISGIDAVGLGLHYRF